MLRNHHNNPSASLAFAHQAQLYFWQRPFAPVMRRHALLWLALLICIAGFNPTPVFAQGIITTVAGNGSRGFAGDGGPAVNAALNIRDFTGGVAADAAGNLYIADTGNHRVRKIDRGGIISTIAGNGAAGFSGDGGPATSAALNYPSGLATDLAGNLYIVDGGNQRIRKVSPNGIITTVAGNGVAGFSGDGGPATSASLHFNRYTGNCAVDNAGNLYIPDTDNGRVRKVDPSGIITSVVTGLRDPDGVAADAAGNLFITDSSNDQILKVGLSGVITTIASSLNSPSGVALDRAGNLYIADSHSHRIRKVEPNGVTSVIAGSGDPIFVPSEGYYFVGGFSGDGCPATSALLNFPWGVAVDEAGNVYIADSLNNRIRKVTAATAGYDPTFNNPDGILFGPFGSDPYPSSLTVSGLAGTVSKVTVTLRDLRLQSPDRADLAFLLVGPRGQSSILMSGVGMDGIGKSLTLTFDDAAPSSLTSNPASGTYKPSPLGLVTFPHPAPSEPSGTTLSVFDGTSANGEWKLYAVNFNDGPSVCTILGEGCAELGGWGLTITTTPALPNQIDDAQFFVRQQYRDFLNREADANGLAFWTNEITSCGGDAQCVEVKRINVSAAYFLSIEFQQTGYLVYRMYKAAYGDLPGAPVPLRLNEFLPDTRKIGQGVIVNQTGWEQALENNKQAFATEFVERSRFTSAYPMSMSPGEFVDKLFANAGVTPSESDRTAAISEFAFATTTTDVAARARALRRVAENSTLAQQEFNRAFVLMQYFGYLRRNPNDPPEPTLDYQGYNFWLTKLNNFNGNFIDAEMVKAFIQSTEYRNRFAL